MLIDRIRTHIRAAGAPAVKAAAAATLALAALTGCGLFGGGISDRDIQMVNVDTMQRIAYRVPDRVALVDVRSPDAFEQQAIPGAINIYLPRLRENDPRLTPARSIVVYDAGGEDPRARVAAKKLLRQGYRDVWMLRGGLELWTARESE